MCGTLRRTTCLGHVPLLVCLSSLETSEMPPELPLEAPSGTAARSYSCVSCLCVLVLSGIHDYDPIFVHAFVSHVVGVGAMVSRLGLACSMSCAIGLLRAQTCLVVFAGAWLCMVEHSDLILAMKVLGWRCVSYVVVEGLHGADVELLACMWSFACGLGCYGLYTCMFDALRLLMSSCVCSCPMPLVSVRWWFAWG